MSQSLARNIIHLVFSTENREPYLQAAIRPGLHAYMAGILAKWQSPAILINSVADHVHILFVLSKNHALCKVVEAVKTGSSKWAKQNGADPAFHWQNGYGAFSVSPSALEQVRGYIADQEEHHKAMDFQNEFRQFLQKHGVEYDERYVWD